MKRYIILLGVILIYIGISPLYADKIYLKNGRVVEGEIIEETNGKVTIKEIFGNSHVVSGYKKSEIERMEKSSEEEKIKDRKELKEQTKREKEAELKKKKARDKTKAEDKLRYPSYKKDIDKILSEVMYFLKMVTAKEIKTKGDFLKWEKEFLPLETEFKKKYLLSKRTSYQECKKIFSALQDFESTKDFVSLYTKIELMKKESKVQMKILDHWSKTQKALLKEEQ